MVDGLNNWMDEKGFKTLDDFRGLSLPRVTDWNQLNLNYKIVADIDHEKCIGCDLCYVACWDGAHQCIHLGHGHTIPSDLEAATRKRITLTPVAKLETNHSRTPPDRIPRIDEEECVGCNLCALVCPVENCITMKPVDRGVPAESWAQRVTGGNAH